MRSVLLAVLLAGCAATTPSDRAARGAPSASPPPPAPRGPVADAGATPVEPPPATQAAASEPPAQGPAAPRLTSQGYITWIWAEPKVKKGTFLGYVRYGSSVALKSTEPVKGDGCRAGFYAVEPRGYVCRDGTVTLEPSRRFVDASAATSAKEGPFPYRYAISNGTPMYNRVPKPDEQARKERPYGRAGKFLKQPKSMSAHEDLANVAPIAPSDEVPPFLADGKQAEPARFGLVRQEIPLGSMLSFTRAFEAQGRTWLLSPDLTLVPADRVRPFRPSSFRGVKLEGDLKLPIAWMRSSPRPQYAKGAAGALEQTGRSWPVRSFVRITGGSLEQGGRRFLETGDQGEQGGSLWIAEDDATVVEAETKLPFGVSETQKKWVLVRVTQGTLVAYENLRPVYATLISPGSGGVSIPGADPVKMSTTPRGTYFVTFKDRATTMSPDKEGDERKFWIADVPHTQYFNPPFALHATYWHERFGEPTSAGCVNLSPIDAEALFGWSDPPVPEGWQGVTGAGAKENGPTTAIVVWR